MERIAPLAKILAEANGIEWEHLSGTGPSGQITEQDILDYLTRVMSGEAEPPSTPVDAPPPDWTGEDTLPDMSQFDTSALSKAGVESDLTDYMQNQSSAAATPALDTDDFELDDEPAPAPEPVLPAASAPVSVPETPAPAAPAAGGLGSLLSRLYHKDETPAAPAVTTPAPSPAPTTPAPAISTPAPSLESNQPAFTAPVAETVPAPVAAPPVESVKPAPEAPAAPSQPTFTPAPTPVDPTVTEAAVTEPAPVEPAAAVTEPVPAPSNQPAFTAPAEAAPATSVVPAASASSNAPRDAVWFGTYLRRDADVSTLSDLQGQLSEALEREVPLALLVARAAQRHAADLRLSSVAMQDTQANQAMTVAEGSLREAVASSQSFDGTPALLVTDAGRLGLDDLHYPQTLTLSVGRVQDGRASLSLQGDVDPAEAAAFLGRVAATLEKPVILLV